MQTSLMPARPPPPPPADSHVLRTRASPSATTNAVDYTDEELMGPEGAMMGRDDSKIVCKFSPVSNEPQFLKSITIPMPAQMSLRGPRF